MWSSQLRFGAVLWLLVLAGVGGTRAGEPASKNVYPATLKGTVLLKIKDPRGAGIGTGWIVDRARRLVVTNHHVVRDASHVEAVFPLHKDGKPVGEASVYAKAPFIRGRVVDSDPKRDLALVQLESLPAGVTELKLAAESVGPGDRVHSIGNPGSMWVYSSGTVRMVLKSAFLYSGNQKVEARIVETQAPINPGDSGGPVVNDAGEVVAVTSGFNQKGVLISFGIDISEVRGFLKESEKWLTARTAEEFKKRAQFQHNHGRFLLAIEDFTAASRLNPNDGDIYRERGWSFFLAGEDHKAIADAVVALRLNPKDALAYRNRGTSFFAIGETEQAIADLKDSLQINPSDPETHRFLGMGHQRKGMNEAARNDFDEAIRLDPNYALGYALRGDLAFAQADYAGAVKDYGEAIQRGEIAAYLKRADAHAKKNDLTQAMKDYDAAIKASPSAAAYTGRGNVYRRLQKFENALANFEAAIKLDPRHGPAFVAAAILFNFQQKYESALAYCNTALQLNPRDGEAFLERGRALMNKAQLDDALLDLQQSSELLPANSIAHNLLGICYAGKKDYDKAVRSYDKAIELSPKVALYYSNRGRFNYNRADYDGAIADLTKALELRPQSALDLHTRGRAHQMLGNQQKAQKDLEAARKLDPKLK